MIAVFMFLFVWLHLIGIEDGLYCFLLINSKTYKLQHWVKKIKLLLRING